MKNEIQQVQEQDKSTTSAFKVTLPDNVFQELTDYSDALSLTKSDVIKEAVREKIGRDSTWLSKIFLFKKHGVNQDYVADLQECLKVAKRGALIKVAGSYDTRAAYANGWIFQLISFDNDSVQIEPTAALPPTFLDNLTNEISMEKGTLLVPKIAYTQGLYGTPVSHMTYQVPLEYVWGIDCNITPAPNTAPLALPR